jgi:hypothetical protein
MSHCRITWPDGVNATIVLSVLPSLLRLALRADAVLEGREQEGAEVGEVVGLSQRLGLAHAGHRVVVVQFGAVDDLPHGEARMRMRPAGRCRGRRAGEHQARRDGYRRERRHGTPRRQDHGMSPFAGPLAGQRK